MTVELSERYSKALARYVDTINKEAADRPYPKQPLTADFFVECALREFWRANHPGEEEFLEGWFQTNDFLSKENLVSYFCGKVR